MATEATTTRIGAANRRTPSLTSRPYLPVAGVAARSLRDGDLPLEDLAGRALGELVDEPDAAGGLVGRDVLLDERADVVLGGVLAVLERHCRADLLAQRLMRHAEHRRLADRRMLVEHLLDLPRVDVEAAADDQLLLAVDDVEVAVLVDPGHVPGPQPAVGHGVGRGVLALPVGAHDHRTADEDLPHLAVRDLLVV